jgi:hypothetical protein
MTEQQTKPGRPGGGTGSRPPILHVWRKIDDGWMESACKIQKPWKQPPKVPPDGKPCPICKAAKPEANWP